VYNRLNMQMLFDAVPVDNILFGSECDGAFPGVVNDETHDHYDNTRRYVDDSKLNAGDKDRIYAVNARRVYPRASRWIQS
jgi:4-oxalmesaconate hydratase